MPDITQRHEVQQQQEAAVSTLAQDQNALQATEAARPRAQAAQNAEIAGFAEKLKTFAAQVAEPGGVGRERDQVEASIERISKTQQRETSSSAEVASEVVATLNQAVQQLDRQQAAALDAASQRPEVQPDRLLSDHQRQRDDLAALIRRSSSSMELNSQEMRNRQLLERGRLAELVGSANPSSGVRDAAVQSERESRASLNSQRRLLSFVETVAEEILRRPTSEQVDRFRQQTGITADQLDDGALQRVVRAADRTPGAAGVDAARGQITEELHNQRAQAEVERTGDAREQFVAGHRITDGLGKQLTDGLIIRKEENGYRPTDGFEVKAGRPSARELLATREKDRSAEVVAAARDAAGEELSSDARSADLSPDQRTEVHERILAQMRGNDVQRTRGQLEQTAERLDQQRIFIDGVELHQVAEQDKRLVPVRAVLAKDTVLVDSYKPLATRRRDSAEAGPVPEPDRPRPEPIRLEQTEQEIKDLARKILAAADEWRRQP